MTTLTHLVAEGKLIKHVPLLDRDQMPKRFAYFAPEVVHWLRRTLSTSRSDRGRVLSPIEEVEVLLRDFAAGRPMAYSLDYRKLDPLTQHIWELKSIDVRLIGWFPRQATFVAVCGRLKKDIPRARLYGPCIQHAVWFRDNLDLDLPKFISGVNHNDVL
jgi:hypothetical protein